MYPHICKLLLFELEKYAVRTYTGVGTATFTEFECHNETAAESCTLDLLLSSVGTWAARRSFRHIGRERERDVYV